MKPESADTYQLGSLYGDYARSEEASSLRLGWIELQRSSGMRAETQAALEELDRARSDASTVDWDGDGAPAMSLQSYAGAYQLLLSLPMVIRMPEVAPDPRGGVLLSWSEGGDRMFTISIDDHDQLHYAGIAGMATFRGAERAHGRLAEPVLEGLRRVLLRDRRVQTGRPRPS